MKERVSPWILAASVLASLAGAGCASAPDLSRFTAKPSVELRSVQLQDPSLTAATLVMELSITNPNPVSVDLSRMDYALDLNGTEVARGILEKDLELEAGKSVSVQIPVRFHYLDAFRSISELARTGAISYKFRGSMSAEPFEIPFRYDGSVSLPQGAGGSAQPAMPARRKRS